jgi:hypothetical protein
MTATDTKTHSLPCRSGTVFFSRSVPQDDHGGTCFNTAMTGYRRIMTDRPTRVRSSCLRPSAFGIFEDDETSGRRRNGREMGPARNQLAFHRGLTAWRGRDLHGWIDTAAVGPRDPLKSCRTSHWRMTRMATLTSTRLCGSTRF